MIVSAFGVLAVVVGFVIDVGGVRTWWADSVEPSLALSLYEERDGRFQLLDGALELTIDADDVSANTVRLPVQIAMNNRDSRRLDVVRVTLSYPADIEVTSAGRARIDPTGRTVVYEHEIGVLEAVDGFTPIEPLDELVVPFEFTPVPTVALAQGNVPVYVLTIVGVGAAPFDDLRIPVEVSVQASGRPEVRGRVTYLLQPGVRIVPQGSGQPISRAPTDQEHAAFRAPEGSLPSVEWSGAVNEEGDIVAYRKYESASAATQVIAVNDVLRRLISDADSDGNIDYEMVDDSGDGVADQFITYDGAQPMVDWPEEALSY